MQETSASESSARGEDTAGRQITNLGEIRFRGGHATARVEDTPKVAVTKRLFPHPVLIPELNHSRVGERGSFPLYANERQQQQQKRARYVNVARYFISASQTVAKVGSARSDDGNFYGRNGDAVCDFNYGEEELRSLVATDN